MQDRGTLKGALFKIEESSQEFLPKLRNLDRKSFQNKGISFLEPLSSSFEAFFQKHCKNAYFVHLQGGPFSYIYIYTRNFALASLAQVPSALRAGQSLASWVPFVSTSSGGDVVSYGFDLPKTFKLSSNNYIKYSASLLVNQTRNAPGTVDDALLSLSCKSPC